MAANFNALAQAATKLGGSPVEGSGDHVAQLKAINKSLAGIAAQMDGLSTSKNYSFQLGRIKENLDAISKEVGGLSSSQRR